MTREEWYEGFDEHREVLSSLVRRYYPIGAKSSPEARITADGAERACEMIREEIASEPTPDIDQLLDSKEFSWALLGLLSSTWFGMPESMDVRYEPGFYQLCDLCEGIDEDCPE